MSRNALRICASITSTRGLEFVFAAIALAVCSACATGYHETAEQVLPESTAAVSPDVYIPKAFFGCWEGGINGFDTVTPLSFSGHFVSGAMQTTYQFCLRRTSEGGAVMQLTRLEIAGQQATVKRFDSHITSTNPQGPGAHLRNHVVVESTANLFWLFPVSAQQDIFADEDIVLTPQDVIAMQGKQLVRMNGADIAEMTFHGDFHRVAGS
jgi:hypothetical protein